MRGADCRCSISYSQPGVGIPPRVYLPEVWRENAPSTLRRASDLRQGGGTRLASDLNIFHRYKNNKFFQCIDLDQPIDESSQFFLDILTKLSIYCGKISSRLNINGLYHLGNSLSLTG